MQHGGSTASTAVVARTPLNISLGDFRLSTPAATGVDLVGVAVAVGLQRGGTPSKPAGFGAINKRSREVEIPRRGLHPLFADISC